MAEPYVLLYSAPPARWEAPLCARLRRRQAPPVAAVERPDSRRWARMRAGWQDCRKASALAVEPARPGRDRHVVDFSAPGAAVANSIAAARRVPRS